MSGGNDEMMTFMGHEIPVARMQELVREHMKNTPQIEWKDDPDYFAAERVRKSRADKRNNTKVPPKGP